MTDRDRLIELLKKTEYTPFPGMTMKSNLGNQFTEYALNCIVDELLANGVIVPPCKVGDKVYWINFVTKEIETDIVIAIHQYSNGFTITTDTVGTKTTCTFSSNRFFETIFLTKEEAEERLKKINEMSHIQK